MLKDYFKAVLTKVKETETGETLSMCDFFYFENK